MRKTLAAVTLSGLVFALLGPTTPAGAASTVSGAALVTCKTSLPAWPTASGSSTCGTYLVGAAGAGAGVTTTNNPYVIAGKGSFSSSFSYSEPCVVAGQSPVLGTAKGTATASGFTAVVKTSKTTASETSGFSWTRVGLVAVITTSGTKITFGNGQVATAVAPGAGVGSFAPLNFNPKKNVCPSGGQLTAVVGSVFAGTA